MSFAKTPDKTIKDIRFGMAISPFAISLKDHAISSATVEPTKTNTENTIRYI